MAKLQPWYKIATPREDLREGKPLDAAEFAVHLDQVRDGRGSEDYSNPARFTSRYGIRKGHFCIRWKAPAMRTTTVAERALRNIGAPAY